MKNTIRIGILILLISFNTIVLFAQSAFTKGSFTPMTSYGFSIIPTGHTFFLSGTGISNFNSKLNYQLAKLDSEGNILWQRRYGGPLDDRAYIIASVKENGYTNLLCMGESQSFDSIPIGPNGEVKIYVIKTDENGDTLWTRIYGQGRYPAFCLSNDSNYMITVASGKATLIKANFFDGDTIWTKNYDFQFGPPGVYMSFAGGIVNIDSGFIIAGNMIPSNNAKFMLMRTDSIGNSIWCKTYGDTAINNCWSMIHLANGGFIMAGQSATSDSSWQDFMVVRVKDNGDTVWCKRYDYNNGSETAQHIIETDDGEFLVFGIAQKFYQGNTLYDKSMGIKIDSLGNLIWAKLYDYGYIKSLQKLNSGFVMGNNILMVADSSGNSCTSQNVSITVSHMNLNITNQTPTVTGGLPYCYRPHTLQYSDSITLKDYCIILGGQVTENKIVDIDVFPNPANDYVTIKFPEQMLQQNLSIKIIDAMGNVIVVKNISSEQEIELPTQNITNGIYFLQVVTDEQKMLCKKVLILH